MPHSLAQAVVAALAAYVGIGVFFALWFVLIGVRRVDHDAAGGSVGFRVLIFPASVALWPLLVVRASRGVEAPQESNAHRRATRGASR